MVHTYFSFYPWHLNFRVWVWDSPIPLKSVTVALTSILILYCMRVRWRRWRGCSLWHLSLSHVLCGCLDWFTVWLSLDPTSHQHNGFKAATTLIDWHAVAWRMCPPVVIDVACCWRTSFYVGWVAAGLDSHTSKVCGTTKSSPDLEHELIM